MQSYLFSGMVRETTYPSAADRQRAARARPVSGSRPLRHLDSRHRLDQEPEERARRGQDQDEQHRSPQRDGGDQGKRGEDDRDREQRLHSEHGPVAGLPHAERDDAQDARYEQAARDRAAVAVAGSRPGVPAGNERDEVRERDTAAAIAPTVTAVGRSPGASG